MKKGIILGAIVIAAVVALPSRTYAADQVCFCHNIQNNPVTVCTDNQGLINGHSGHVESGMDILGRCEDIPAVPEFGLVTAGLATVLSGGSLFALRKKIGL